MYYCTLFKVGGPNPLLHMARSKFLLSSISAIVLCGCLTWWFNHRAAPSNPIKNLVIISLDTLRADRLGSYGYHRRTSPSIDNLAKKSTVFENVVTTAPWTLPSHVSMLSGLFPYTHGVQKSKRLIPKSVPLLAELLDAQGYTTIGVTGGGFLARQYGFNRGFDSYVEAHQLRAGADETIIPLVKRAKEELVKVATGSPYFLFFHTYDIHCPYSPPSGYLGKFISENTKEIETNHCGNPYYNSRTLSKPEALHVSDRYDESILAVDDELSGLLNYLGSRADADDTAIIITSDHGEEFLEHGQIGHQDSVFKELLMVPLIFHLPNAPAQRVTQHISLVDIVPTVLDLMGVPSKRVLDGESLAITVMRGTPPSNGRPFEFTELHRGRRMFSKITDTSHLIVDSKLKRNYFFDLKNDPLEQHDISASKEDWFKEENAELSSFLASLKRGKADEPIKNSNDQLQRLKSLGYLK